MKSRVEVLQYLSIKYRKWTKQHRRINTLHLSHPSPSIPSDRTCKREKNTLTHALPVSKREYQQKSECGKKITTVSFARPYPHRSAKPIYLLYFTLLPTLCVFSLHRRGDFGSTVEVPRVCSQPNPHLTIWKNTR